jgi:hypothetical protein
LIDAVPHQVSDVQVNLLANGGAFTRPAGPHDLKRATEVLPHMAMLRVVEMLDETMVAGEYFLRPAFPMVRREYVAQNVARSAPTEEDELHQAVRAACPAKPDGLGTCIAGRKSKSGGVSTWCREAAESLDGVPIALRRKRNPRAPAKVPACAACG